MHDTRTGRVSETSAMLRKRIFDNAHEGELLGKKLAVTDPIALAAHNRAEIEKVMASKDLMKRIREGGLRASDGRPMVALAGSGHLVESSTGHNPAVLVNPNTMQGLRIANKVVEGLRKSGDLDRLIRDEKIYEIGKNDKGEPM